MITAASIGLIAAAGRQSAPALTLPTTNLFAAYEARTGVTQSPAGYASGWADIGPNGYDLSQGDNNLKPLITTVDGHAALNFSFNSPYLRQLTRSGVTSLNTLTRTIYVVWRIASNANYYRALRAATTAGTEWVGLFNPSGTRRYGIYNGAERTPAIAVPGTLHRTTFIIPTTATLTVDITGGTQASVFKSAAAFGADTTISIGAVGGVYYSLDAEIVSYYEYTAAHNTAVEDYIFQEWGV